MVHLTSTSHHHVTVPYRKKAQVCHCESANCRGIIGGEKHTPLKSIISGRPGEQNVQPHTGTQALAYKGQKPSIVKCICIFSKIIIFMKKN